MIDYGKIAKSLEYFQELGYTRIEAPWWVSEEVINITKPEGTGSYSVKENNKMLVGSGEQSFLYMAAKDRLPKGKYVTTTPCFRNESIGGLHKKCFIKTEIIITDDVESKVFDISEQALEFFKLIVPDKNKLNTVLTEEGVDINYGNIEIGSYGLRSCPFLTWIYGTACAEPRLSKAISQIEFKDN